MEIREEDEGMYFFPKIYDPDNLQNTVATGKDIPDFITMQSKYFEMKPLIGSSGSYTFYLIVLDDYDED